jgi:DNA-binding NarL/FixJ family response regulator
MLSRMSETHNLALARHCASVQKRMMDEVRPKVRIFVVDDHPVVRRGFQLLLSFEPDFMVCGEADNLPAALEKIIALQPDVVIVDLLLKTGSGLELIKQLRAQSLKMKLLVYTMQDEATYAERALKAGAGGYVTKEEGAEKAIHAIRLVMDGKRYVSESVATKMMKKLVGLSTPIDAALETLSDRELEILELLGRGVGSRDIAGKLRLSLKTIESHREHIKEKLGLSCSSELVNRAYAWVQREQAVCPPAQAQGFGESATV